MKEELVSFELAKKLKEIRFPQHRCLEVYPLKDIFKKDKDMCSYSKGELSFVFEESLDEDIVYENSAVAPTLSLAQKWFREEHGIHIQVGWQRLDSPIWDYEIHRLKSRKNIDDSYFILDSGNKEYKSYEQALEKGLLKACEIIKKK